jgi:hypothetical protein
LYPGFEAGVQGRALKQMNCALKIAKRPVLPNAVCAECCNFLAMLSGYFAH